MWLRVRIRMISVPSVSSLESCDRIYDKFFIVLYPHGTSCVDQILHLPLVRVSHKHFVGSDFQPIVNDTETLLYCLYIPTTLSFIFIFVSIHLDYEIQQSILANISALENLLSVDKKFSTLKKSTPQLVFEYYKDVCLGLTLSAKI